ncbi:MAG: hypothetical protein OXG82_16870 [Gammaproteobacteria bacterium]|nr:hypothetical protein [Gammaproteobacteria bacterium]
MDEIDIETRGRVDQALAELADSPRAADAYSWVIQIAQETERLEEVERYVPLLDRLSVGFFDPEVDGSEGFGLIAYSSAAMDVAAGAVAQTREFRLNTGGHQFPLIIRTFRRDRQVSLTSPNNALLTCYGRSADFATTGWLTCRHAVGAAGSVVFSDHSSGTIAADWGECIDAALVHGGPNGPASHVPCLRGVAGGVDVRSEDQAGNRVRATIVDVDVNVGVVRARRFPIRFTYNWTTSLPGDSGAMVYADPCGEPLGMHQGAATVTNPVGGTKRLAYGLCLFQLEDFGGLEVYQ